MSAVIYCRIGTRVNGPFTPEQFKKLLNSNKVPVTAEVSATVNGPWESVAVALARRKIKSETTSLSVPPKEIAIVAGNTFPPPAVAEEDTPFGFLTNPTQQYPAVQPPMPPPIAYPTVPQQYPPSYSNEYPPPYQQQPQIIYVQSPPAQPQQPTIHIVNTNTNTHTAPEQGTSGCATVAIIAGLFIITGSVAKKSPELAGGLLFFGLITVLIWILVKWLR